MFVYKHVSNACFVYGMGLEKAMKRVDLILLVFENVFKGFFFYVCTGHGYFATRVNCALTQNQRTV